MAMEVDIAIVGGGLGGLALALGLQERGVRAHVFEKAPKVRVHSGTAISLGVNGLRALDGLKIGLSATLTGKGAEVTKLRGRSRVDGGPERVTSIPCPPGTMFNVPWRSAHQTLAEEIVDHSLLHWRHLLVDYKAIEGGVEAQFEAPTDEEVGQSPFHIKVVRAKLLVGADGIRSQVRKFMIGDEPRDLLHTTWNAIVPTQAMSSLNLHEEHEIKFFMYRATNCVKTVFLADAGSGLTLWQVRVLDESGDIPKAHPKDLEAHGRDVRKVRVRRQMEDLEWIENLRTAIEGTDPDSVREARAYDRLPLTSWSDPSKRVVLLGDAAHGMYPGPGEGARTAFEDAHQLSLILQEALASSTPQTAIPDAVTRFEEMRIPRTSKIQAHAAETTNLPHLIPEWVRDLPPEEKQRRLQEFRKWTVQLPRCHVWRPRFHLLETMISSPCLDC